MTKAVVKFLDLSDANATGMAASSTLKVMSSARE